MDEKRKFNRLEFQKSVRVFPLFPSESGNIVLLSEPGRVFQTQKDPISALANNISEDGIRLELIRSFDRNLLVKIILEFEENQFVEVYGKILWSLDNHNGVHFLNVNQRLRDRIKAIKDWENSSKVLSKARRRSRWVEDAETIMKNLNPLEKAVLEKILDGKHPILRGLRKQLERVVVSSRKVSGIGFFTGLMMYETLPSKPSIGKRIALWDVEATIPGLEQGASFILFVQNGYLQMLEGYTNGGTWPKNISFFELKYHEPDRKKFLDSLDEEIKR